MKKLILLAALFVVACSSVKEQTDVEKAGLKGKVKSVRDVYSLQNPQELDSATVANYLNMEYYTEYNEQGYTVKEYNEINKGDRIHTVTYERDKNNRILKQLVGLDCEELTHYIVYKYDDKGLNTQQIEYSNTDSIQEITNLSYNDKGLVEKRVTETPNGTVKKTSTYEYNEQGKKIKETHTAGDNSNPRTVEYDENGNPIGSSIKCDESPEAGNVDYDEQGNWIEKRNVNRGMPYSEKIKRVIEYYK